MFGFFRNDRLSKGIAGPPLLRGMLHRCPPRGLALAAALVLSLAGANWQTQVTRAQIPVCAFGGGRHYIIGDRVWLDQDQDGIQDAGEVGLPNVTVKLFRTGQGTQQAGQCRTNADGNYWLDASVGTYYLQFTRPAGYMLSPKDAADDLLDSDPDPSTGRTPTFYLSSGAPEWHSARWDAGMFSEGGGSGGGSSVTIGLDHGDAPLSFPQTEHKVYASGATLQPTLTLATRVDTEDVGSIVRTGLDGKLAVGDDKVGIPDPNAPGNVVSDEDAVPFAYPPPGVNHHVVIRGRENTYETYVQGSGLLNAWIDFNLDGTWDNGSERVANNVPTTGGRSGFTFTVPSDAAITYDPAECRTDPSGCHDWQDPNFKFSYMRIRLSSQPLNDPATPAEDGEVEDHSIDIIEARPDVGVYFESVSRDPAIVGQPFTYGMLVDNKGYAAATNVVVRQQLQPGAEFVSAALTSGPTGATVACTMNTTTRILTCALSDLPSPLPMPQIRYNVVLNLTGKLGCNSMRSIADVSIAESENYLPNNHAERETPLVAGSAWDFADSPVSNNAVWWQGGPRHHVVGNLHLGNGPVDTEPFAHPNAGADGDDLMATDDEDGVELEEPLIKACKNGGQPGKVKVIAASAGTLSAWFNFNGDTTFANASPERVVLNQALTAGEHVLDITVPCDAVVGPTYARFRFVAPDVTVSSARDPECTTVLSGEVEDHVFTVFEQPSEANLVIDKSDLFDPVAEGEEFSYKIKVTNNGTEDARNVTVTDVLPSQLTYIGMTTTDPSAICAIDIGTPSISCSFAEIKGGRSLLITIDVQVKDDVVPVSDPPLPEGDGLDIFNTAYVNWDGGEERSDTEKTRIVKPCALDLVLVIDVSLSMSTADLDLIGQSGIDLLDQLNVGETDSLNRAAVVTFDDAVVDQVHLIDPRSQLDALLGNIGRGTGLGTDLVVGLEAAQDELDTNGRKDSQGNRTALPVIILLSDGEHNGDPAALLQAADAIKASGTRIYTVAYGSNGTGGGGVAMMQSLSTRPSDYAFASNTVQGIADKFADIAARHCTCSPCPTTPAPTTAVPTTPVPTTPVPTTPPPPSCATISADRACTPTNSCASSWCEWTVVGTLPALACDPNAGALYSLDVTVDACDGQIANMWVVLPTGVHAMQRVVPWSTQKWQLSLDCLTARPPSTFTLRWINLTGGYPGAGPKHVDYTVCCTTCP